MLPKKKQKKAGKVSKAQRTKRQQEEEERRLREEEEARIRAEREEQERVERERKQKEVERLELKDLERREAELKELHHLLEENHTAVTKWKTEAVETAKWERYMRCDGAPDPAVQKEMNTYMSLWRDDPEVNITLVLQQCNLALQLVDELEDFLKDVTDPQEGQKYQKVLMNLQELIHSKHHLATEEILKSASENVSTETGNMQTVIKDDNITLCLWANLNKIPRFKSVSFSEAGLSFELPKQLAVSDIAVRILHTRYDHLSSLARMTHLRTHTLNDRVYPAMQSTQRMHISQSAASLWSRRSSPEPEESQVSHVQTQMEALDVRDPIGPPEEHTVINPVAQVVDLMEYTPLGGVFYYDAFHLPPQIQYAHGWKFVQVLRTGMQVFSYQAEKSGLDGHEALPCPLVGVSVTLPDSVVFLEAPQVARWDPAGKQWRMDGITDISYDESEAKISFKMDSFQAFALMQKTYANLPFQSWELQPLGQDSALYTVNGAFINISITIQDNKCMLQSEQEGGLSHLIGKWMSGSDLQKAMVDAGVNIFVNEYAHKYVSSTAKDPLTEHAAYEQMALFSSACAFSWSKWNAKCGAEHLIMQVCEHHNPSPVPKDSWSLYLLGAQRSRKLAITETSEAFSPDHYPGSEFHSTFIHLLQDTMSPDGVARTRNSHHLFVDTVQSLLCATRPLMYS
ncbi:dynein intermediate chain CFAP94, axonemal isoform X1 [Simochromis diagramma]|uniref:dynein intermediate chain CFAP94, axonemal isoform X1 n=1 Tax=Simochromis diagramma TaxID=43689 RepID=UPI001A7EC732|nr:dynein intermediate chain CFAP94, axonemal isoform X1 [Simochromis diagramma]